MFSEATNFNHPLDKWDVSNSTSFSFMFSKATNFNQDIGNWNVNNYQRFASMFNKAISFNQDLSLWNINTLSHPCMFLDCNIKEEFKPIPSAELENSINQMILDDYGDY